MIINLRNSIRLHTNASIVVRHAVLTGKRDVIAVSAVDPTAPHAIQFDSVACFNMSTCIQGSGQTRLKIDKCLFARNKIGLDGSNYGSAAQITNTVFAGNDCGVAGYGWIFAACAFVANSVSAVNVDNAYVSHSYFVNNRVGITNGFIGMEDCLFFQNVESVHITAEHTSIHDITFVQDKMASIVGDASRVRRINFIECSGWAVQHTEAKDISLDDYIYWGTTNITEIRNHVMDALNGGNGGFVSIGAVRMTMNHHNLFPNNTVSIPNYLTSTDKLYSPLFMAHRLDMMVPNYRHNVSYSPSTDEEENMNVEDLVPTDSQAVSGDGNSSEGENVKVDGNDGVLTGEVGETVDDAQDGEGNKAASGDGDSSEGEQKEDAEDESVYNSGDGEEQQEALDGEEETGAANASDKGLSANSPVSNEEFRAITPDVSDVSDWRHGADGIAILVDSSPSKFGSPMSETGTSFSEPSNHSTSTHNGKFLSRWLGNDDNVLLFMVVLVVVNCALLWMLSLVVVWYCARRRNKKRKDDDDDDDLERLLPLTKQRTRSIRAHIRRRRDQHL